MKIYQVGSLVVPCGRRGGWTGDVTKLTVAFR